MFRDAVVQQRAEYETPQDHRCRRKHGERIKCEAYRVCFRTDAAREREHRCQPQRCAQNLCAMTETIPHRRATHDLEVGPRTIAECLDQQRQRHQSPRETCALVHRATCRFTGEPRGRKRRRHEHDMQQHARCIEQQHRRVRQRIQDHRAHRILCSWLQRIEPLRREKEWSG
jgi:hypothetical protein